MPEEIPRVRVSAKINGKQILARSRAAHLLVQFLREELSLTGTHIGCDTSYCGACTVLLNGKSVKSCTVFAFQADGGEVLTVEGLAKDGELHPVQQAFSDCHGFQCGYCTPGFLMSTLQLLERASAAHRGRDSQRHRRQHLPLHRISEHLQGNSGRRRGWSEELVVGHQIFRRVHLVRALRMRFTTFSPIPTSSPRCSPISRA